MKSLARSTRWCVAVIGIAALIAGCGKQPVAPVGTGEPGTYVNPTFARVSAPRGSNSLAGGAISGSGDVDGAAGGEVAVGRFRVIVPPGAFPGTANIQITIPDPEVVSCELHISPPEANHFAIPVKLVADCQGVSNVDLEDCGTLWFDEDAQVWRTVRGTAVDLENRTVTASLRHFSIYGICDLLDLLDPGKAGW